MAYNFLSNINNFDDFNNPNDAYQEINVGKEINFIDNNNILHTGSFLMIRAHESNDLLIQLLPWGYGVYIPANEIWSAESLDNIEGIIIKKSFIIPSLNESKLAKIQWMIGYK